MTERQKRWVEQNMTIGNVITILALVVSATTMIANVRSESSTTTRDVGQLKQQVLVLNEQLIELRTTTAQHSKQLDRIEGAVYTTKDAVTDLPVIKVYRDRPRQRSAH